MKYKYIYPIIIAFLLGVITAMVFYMNKQHDEILDLELVLDQCSHRYYELILKKE